MAISPAFEERRILPPLPLSLLDTVAESGMTPVPNLKLAEESEIDRIPPKSGSSLNKKLKIGLLAVIVPESDVIEMLPLSPLVPALTETGEAAVEIDDETTKLLTVMSPDVDEMMMSPPLLLLLLAAGAKNEIERDCESDSMDNPSVKMSPVVDDSVMVPPSPVLPEAASRADETDPAFRLPAPRMFSESAVD